MLTYTYLLYIVEATGELLEALLASIQEEGGIPGNSSNVATCCIDSKTCE
jgi:hypothetical protein